ncbi:hypothetical protein ENBRE01_1418 [Enteropsectra breve]|nr:hypothetical protein ENBRE01_1418 [Enteropsectra breve]
MSFKIFTCILNLPLMPTLPDIKAFFLIYVGYLFSLIPALFLLLPQAIETEGKVFAYFLITVGLLATALRFHIQHAVHKEESKIKHKTSSLLNSPILQSGIEIFEFQTSEDLRISKIQKLVLKAKKRCSQLYPFLLMSVLGFMAFRMAHHAYLCIIGVEEGNFDDTNQMLAFTMFRVGFFVLIIASLNNLFSGVKFILSAINIIALFFVTYFIRTENIRHRDYDHSIPAYQLTLFKLANLISPLSCLFMVSSVDISRYTLKLKTSFRTGYKTLAMVLGCVSAIIFADLAFLSSNIIMKDTLNALIYLLESLTKQQPLGVPIHELIDAGVPLAVMSFLCISCLTILYSRHKHILRENLTSYSKTSVILISTGALVAFTALQAYLGYKSLVYLNVVANSLIAINFIYNFVIWRISIGKKVAIAENRLMTYMLMIFTVAAGLFGVVTLVKTTISASKLLFIALVEFYSGAGFVGSNIIK